MEHFRKKVGLTTLTVMLLAICFLIGSGLTAGEAQASAKIYGYVRTSGSASSGVNGLYVVAASTTAEHGDGTKANIRQCKTYTYNGNKGYYSITLPNRGLEYGRLEVYANNYFQVSQRQTNLWVNTRNYSYNILMQKSSNLPVASYIGLRESYYGLIRPSAKNWPTDLTPVGTPPLLDYYAPYWGQVGYWAGWAGYNWSPQPGQAVTNPKPTHVLIVTQTEPNFQGESWDPSTNGKTYCLWNKTANDSSDAHLKYLNQLKDTNGVQLTESIVNIDQLLDDYDYFEQDVFIQLEPGHVPISTLLPMVMKRFYKNADGSVKHFCIKGVGVDIEWYKDTNAPEDGETVTLAEVNEWEGLIKGYNPNFKLFVKHWDIGQGVRVGIPKGINASVIVIDDSQGFDNGFATQKSEFKKWLDYYSPNPVGFQIGYPADRHWWRGFTDPVVYNSIELLKHFGTANAARNIGFVWVDFSVRYPEISLGVPNGPTAYLPAHEPPASWY